MNVQGITKHSARRCTVCREYTQHTERHLPVGRWWKKLGTVHLSRGGRKTSCGRRVRFPGMLWTRERKLVDCGSCARTR